MAKVQWIQDVVPAIGSPGAERVCGLLALDLFLVVSGR